MLAEYFVWQFAWLDVIKIYFEALSADADVTIHSNYYLDN